MSKRATRALIAAETMRILEAGEYVPPGAWGCGVFQNDPAEVAGRFADDRAV